MRGDFGKFIVTAITLVLEAPDGQDHKVNLLSANINGFVFTPFVATEFQEVCTFPVDGVTMKITRLSAPSSDPLIIPNDEIVRFTCRVQVQKSVDFFAPDPNAAENEYLVELLVNEVTIGEGTLEFI